MTLQSVLFGIVLAAALTLFGRNVVRLVRYLQIGKAENRFDRVGERLGRVAKIAFGQTKLLREPFAGVLHFLIFWGFVILLTAILESIGEGLVPGFSFAFLGPVYPALAFLQDLVGLLVVVSVLVSIVRRLVAPPRRLKVEGHSKWDAVLILGLIFTVMLTMFGQNATRMVLHPADADSARFVSIVVLQLLSASDPGPVTVWYAVFFWGHMLAVLGFLNYLPYSKHLHILASVPNVYFSDLGPRGALKPLNLADETATKFGATDVEDLSWKQLLNSYTCTECGRCTASCPANTTGKLLNPKKVFVDMRARTMEKAPVLLAGGTDGDADRDAVLAHQLLDGFVTEQELWACTTCMACVQECPVMIEHVEAIVDMRRGLVLNESRFPDELKVVFSNLERNYTPWGFGHSTRADWAQGLDVPLMADVKSAEVLFWVGCAGSYDARYQKVSRAFVQLLKMAGVNFAILGTEEKCNGDPARRMGNEYLAQTLMAENIATLNGYGVKRIVVTCPHCLQSLGKEYKQFGGDFEVVHHSTLLAELIRDGRLRIAKERRATLTFHDPCYLGRYQDEYDAPRDVLSALNGTKPAEMRRSRDRSFCCGAGGGRMWMEEREGKRVNVERTEEALALHPDVIGTGCPFCMTMLTDGVKEKNAAERVEVKDIAELVLEAVEQPQPA
ncbi:MAG: (Fe-S)-binding protein [Bacteroidetes bacterium]|nr:(Fe-S)-binding protein [Bacteroidota bacterium]